MPRPASHFTRLRVGGEQNAARDATHPSYKPLLVQTVQFDLPTRSAIAGGSNAASAESSTAVTLHPDAQVHQVGFVVTPVAAGNLRNSTGAVQLQLEDADGDHLLELDVALPTGTGTVPALRGVAAAEGIKGSDIAKVALSTASNKNAIPAGGKITVTFHFTLPDRED